jgi:hypothetical protein
VETLIECHRVQFIDRAVGDGIRGVTDVAAGGAH